MTEQAAQAKRLFDAERWVEAERSLARVVAGDTGDDEGNRHLAEYHAAIAIYRQARHAEAAARFRVITRRPSHLKFNETLLWLIELARDDRTLVQIADFAPYTDEHAAKFNNANQRVLFGAASYLVGRARYDEGRLQDAEPMFFHAASQEPWAAHARQCLTRVRQHRGR
jgi:TolA-binding protein